MNINKCIGLIIEQLRDTGNILEKSERAEKKKSEKVIFKVKLKNRPSKSSRVSKRAVYLVNGPPKASGSNP